MRFITRKDALRGYLSSNRRRIGLGVGIDPTSVWVRSGNDHAAQLMHLVWRHGKPRADYSSIYSARMASEAVVFLCGRGCNPYTHVLGSAAQVGVKEAS